MQCHACEAKAKYKVNEHYCCKRHLAITVDRHAPIGGYEVKVKILKINND